MAERLSSWWLHVCSVVLSLPWEPTTFILGVILYKPYFLGLKSPPFCMVLGSKGFFGGNDLIWWVGVVHLGGWLKTTGLESLLFEVSSFLEDSWYLGGDSQLTSIFQMGWNHQLGMNTSQHNFFAVCFFSPPMLVISTKTWYIEHVMKETKILQQPREVVNLLQRGG